MRLRRPSHGTVVAYLALFVALGGSAYAAGLINGSSIKNRSVPGTKLKRNAISGTEVNEARLGRVPAANVARRADAATTADSATRAQNAAALGGLGADAFLRANGTAGDSAKLGGSGPEAFLRSNATAADAVELGGLPASAYERSGRTVPFGPVTLDPDQTPVTPITSGPLALRLRCPTISAAPHGIAELTSGADITEFSTFYTEGVNARANTGGFDAGGSFTLIDVISVFTRTAVGSASEPGGHALLWHVYGVVTASGCTFYGSATPLP